MYETNEPIFALATALSPSALAVIRASGDDALEMIRPYFSGKIGDKSNIAHYGSILDKDKSTIDEVVLISYTQNHGYTSEEAFEIMCHGSIAVIKKISTLLKEIGFREALRGEFTYRAFMHGKMDLTEAEAVEELVKTKSENGRKEAVKRLGGSIKKEVGEIRAELLNMEAGLEVYLDYGEDEIIDDFVFPEERVNSLIDRLKRLYSTYSASRLYSEGAKVVIAGSTNAGKSSLFNALLKENRAIVSETAGTTRDYIEAECNINGFSVRLFDTAGLRDTSSLIEKEGINRSYSLMDESDLIMYVLDIGEEEPKEKDKKTIYIHSKRDISKCDGISFSSLTGEGIADVVGEIEKALSSLTKKGEDVPLIESERQALCLKETIEALEKARENKEESIDIVALFFQEALTSCAEITGEITNDEILEELFSSFCLGK